MNLNATLYIIVSSTFKISGLIKIRLIKIEKQIFCTSFRVILKHDTLSNIYILILESISRPLTLLKSFSVNDWFLEEFQ